MDNPVSQLFLLASALAIGLLVGVERGWRNRELAEGKRVAGFRTFGLIGLLGGIGGVMTQFAGPYILGVIFFALAALVVVAYMAARKSSPDISATSHVAMLVTFMLGALAGLNQVAIAAACAVVVTLILRSKRFLHQLLYKLSDRELNAGLQLLLISLVLLPVLPNQGYGPWQALNPYEIWWMVVLIAAISFVGYFLIRIVGVQKGILMTGIAGGLLSSTALTLQLSRLSKTQPSTRKICSVAILIACAVMFVRVVLIAGVINPALVASLYLPMLVMFGITMLLAGLIYRQSGRDQIVEQVSLNNPLELAPALWFGALLAAVALLGRAMVEWMGELGVLLLAVASGIADVDAINLTLARMAGSEIVISTAVLGIVLASISNTLVKAMMSVFAGGGEMARWVMLPLVLAAAAGVLVLWL